jgi:hypothetical protein
MSITNIIKLALAILLFPVAGCGWLPPTAGDAQTTVILSGPGNATILTTDNPQVKRTFTFGGEGEHGGAGHELPAIERR